MPYRRKPRMTRQRRVIIEELQGAEWHPTADELYVRVRERLPRISLGTVYRNLELLAERGLIRKVYCGGGPHRFDGSAGQHGHIMCVQCGRIEDVSVEGLEVSERVIAERTGFRVTGHALEFWGVCPECEGRARPQEGL